MIKSQWLHHFFFQTKCWSYNDYFAQACLLLGMYAQVSDVTYGPLELYFAFLVSSNSGMIFQGDRNSSRYLFNFLGYPTSIWADCVSSTNPKTPEIHEKFRAGVIIVIVQNVTTGIMTSPNHTSLLSDLEEQQVFLYTALISYNTHFQHHRVCRL